MISRPKLLRPDFRVQIHAWMAHLETLANAAIEGEGFLYGMQLQLNSDAVGDLDSDRLRVGFRSDMTHKPVLGTHIPERFFYVYLDLCATTDSIVDALVTLVREYKKGAR